MRLSPALRAARMVLAVLALPGCSAAPPSRVPLGWGPLPAGASSAEPPTPAPRRASRPGSSSKDSAGASAGSRGSTETPASPAPAPASRPGEGKDASAAGGAPTGGSSASSPKVAWAGDYRGEDVAVYRLGGIPDRTEKDPNARTTVRAEAEGSVSFVLVDSSNGKEICTLAATTAGARATISEGQHCFDQNGAGASLTAAVKSGFATLDGARLHLEMVLAVELDTEDADAKGTLEYRFDGERR